MRMMNRIGALLALAVVLAALPAVAGEKDGDFWQGLQRKLEQITPQRKAPATTAVGGVRGSKEHSADGLYWKGEEAPAVGEDEHRRFQEAVQAATGGEREVAVERFTAFVKDYPRSPLREDAQLALQTLQPAPADGRQ